MDDGSSIREHSSGMARRKRWECAANQYRSAPESVNSIQGELLTDDGGWVGKPTGILLYCSQAQFSKAVDDNACLKRWGKQKVLDSG